MAKYIAYKDVSYEYQCNFCGKYVDSYKYRVSGSKSTEDVSYKGNVKTTKFLSPEYTKKLAEENLNSDYDSFMNQFEGGNYDKFNSKCPHCGKKQPWSTKNLWNIGAVLNIILLMPVVWYVWSSFSDYASSKSVYGSGATGTTILMVIISVVIVSVIFWFLYYFMVITRKNHEKRTEKSNRPKIKNVSNVLFEFDSY